MLIKIAKCGVCLLQIEPLYVIEAGLLEIEHWQGFSAPKFAKFPGTLFLKVPKNEN